jgi:hypothetical protein
MNNNIISGNLQICTHGRDLAIKFFLISQLVTKGEMGYMGWDTRSSLVSITGHLAQVLNFRLSVR